MLSWRNHLARGRRLALQSPAGPVARRVVEADGEIVLELPRPVRALPSATHGRSVSRPVGRSVVTHQEDADDALSRIVCGWQLHGTIRRGPLLAPSGRARPHRCALRQLLQRALPERRGSHLPCDAPIR
jgi:hypothetical protein